MKYHLVPARVAATEVISRRTIGTASEQELQTADPSVIHADIPARNGTIHVFDKVLLPSG